MKHLPTAISIGAIIVAVFALTRSNTAPVNRSDTTVQGASKKAPSRAPNETEVAELRAQNKALTEKLKNLKNTIDQLDKRVRDQEPARPAPNPAEIEAPPAKDHNAKIPGVQTADEVSGEPVQGDPTNTIHPDTPPDLIEADKEIKAESVRLTAQSEAAAARGDEDAKRGDKADSGKQSR
ncbi:MAG: hypothetical protein ACON3Z_18565 [Bradymonadia bacterium]